MQAAWLIILLVGASIGHTAILAYSNNWWFAHSLPHRFLSWLRLFHGLLVLLGVLAFGLAYVFYVSLGTSGSAGGPVETMAQVYILACALIGLIWVPFITVRRWCRRPPVLL